MNRKRKLLIYGGSLVLLVALEIVLRTAWGFGKMPLYAASSEWEYMTVPEQSGKKFNPGFDELKLMADSARIPLVVFLHAEKPEMQVGKYNVQGQEIIAWCQKNGVKLVKDIDCGFTLDDYRDDIHINARGQRKLANIMLKNLQIFY